MPPSLSQIKEEKVFTKEEKIGASSRWGKTPKASISSWVEFRIVRAQNKKELERQAQSSINFCAVFSFIFQTRYS
jgi:hypothetical protein